MEQSRPPLLPFARAEIYCMPEEDSIAMQFLNFTGNPVDRHEVQQGAWYQLRRQDVEDLVNHLRAALEQNDRSTGRPAGAPTH